MGLTSIALRLTTPLDIRQSIDFKAVTKHHDDKLTMFNDEWKDRFAESNTGGKWNPPCIIMFSDHSSSKPHRTFVCIQELLASLVRVCWTTAVLEELTRSPSFN